MPFDLAVVFGWPATGDDTKLERIEVDGATRFLKEEQQMTQWRLGEHALDEAQQAAFSRLLQRLAHLHPQARSPALCRVSRPSNTPLPRHDLPEVTALLPPSRRDDLAAIVHPIPRWRTVRRWVARLRVAVDRFWDEGEVPDDDLVLECALVVGEVGALQHHADGQEVAPLMAAFGSLVELPRDELRVAAANLPALAREVA